MGNEVKKIDVVTLREELKVLTLAQLEEKYVALDFAELWKKGANKAIAIDVLIKAIVEQQSGPEVSETETEDPKLETTTEGSEGQIDDSIEPGEYEIDQDTLDEYPYLVVNGYNIGDTLVIEEGKPWYKKEDVKLETSAPVINEDEVRHRSIEECDADIKADHLLPKNPDHITDANDVPPSATLNEEDYLASVNGIDSKEINGVSRETINQELANLNGGVPEDQVEKPIETEEEEEILDGNEIVREYEPEVIDESKYTEDEIKENIELCQANLKDALPTTRIIQLRKLEALEAALSRKQSK